MEVKAARGRRGHRLTGTSLHPPHWSGSGMRSAFTLVLGILVCAGTAAGWPLHLEPQVPKAALLLASPLTLTYVWNLC